MKRTIKRILLVPVIFTLLFSMILMPMDKNTVYAASDNVNQVPSVKVGHEFNDPITAPLLRIKEEYVNEFDIGGKQVFIIRLKNAKWLTDNDFKNSKYKSFKSAMEYKASHYLRPLNLSVERISDTMLQATVSDSEYNSDKGTIYIPMLAKVLDKGDAKIEIESDSAMLFGRYTFARATNVGTITSIEDIKTFQDREIKKLRNIVIDETVTGVLPHTSNNTIKLELNEGFKWVKGGIIEGFDGLKDSTGIANIDGNTLKITMNYGGPLFKCRGGIILKGAAIQAIPEVTTMDVTMSIRGDHITNQSLKIATYINSSSSSSGDSGSSTNQLIKFPKVKVGHKFTDPTTASLLLINERHVNEFDFRGSQEFRLRLENAEWLTDNDFKDSKYKSFKTAIESQASHYFRPLSLSIERLSNTTVQATVYDSVYHHDKAGTFIPMLVKTLDQGDMKVIIDGRDSVLTSGTHSFGVVTHGDTITLIENAKDFKDAEAIELGTIEIKETAIGALPNESNKKIKMKLSKGFEWVKGGNIEGYLGLREVTGISKINGSTLELTMDYSKTGYRQVDGGLILKGAGIKATSEATNGDVTMTISGDNITDADVTVATYTKSSNNSSSSSSSEGGGGGGSSAPTKTEDKDDDSIEKALKNSKEVKLSIQDKKEAKTHISLSVLNKVRKADKPLKVENKGISLIFSKQALHVKNLEESGTDATLEISAKAVGTATKDKILSKALKNKGLFQVDSEVFELSCDVVGKKGTTKISNFEEPVAITIDLSDKKLSKEEIRNLTGIRYEKDEKGNIVPVKLGGTYDPNTKTFTFYTDQFSLYGVLKAQCLRKINLRIDDTYANVNNTPNTLELAPTIINNRTMMPLRFVAEGLGADVEWIDETKTVKLELDDKKLSFIIGEKQSGMDVPAMIKNGRTLVPIRYVSENLGANVLWFPSSKKIEIIK